MAGFPAFFCLPGVIEMLHSRPFNFERYELSNHLPMIIDALGKKETLVCHAGYGSFAAVKVLDRSGNEIDYFILDVQVFENC
jgi:hypothetical protein